MAEVIRGRHKGRHVALHQWANDWFTIDGEPTVFSPLDLRLTPDEMAAVLQSGRETSLVGGPRCGTMLVEFEPHEDGTFTRRVW